jgi:methyl-accepting chemotaxis protein
MANALPARNRTPASPGRPGVGLAIKLGGAMLVFALVPLLLAGLLAERLLGGPLVVRHAKILRDLSDRVAGQVGRDLGEEVQALAQLAADPDIAAAAAGAAPAALADRALGAFRERSPQHLALQLSDRAGTQVAAAGTPVASAGTPVASAGTPVAAAGIPVTAPGGGLSGEPWAQPVAHDGAGGVPAVGPLRRDPASGLAVLDLAVPVRRDGAVAGMLRSRLDARRLDALLAAATFQRSGRVALYDPRGTAVLAADDGALGQTLPPVLKEAGVLGAAEPGSSFGLSTQGIDSLFGFAPVSTPGVGRLGWTAVATMDAAEALGSLAAVRKSALVAAGIGALLALGGAAVASSLLRRQANEIRRVAAQAAAGNLAVRAEVQSRDELGLAAAGLNSLLERLGQRSQDEAERDQVQDAITRLLEEVSGVAQGDLTVEAEVTAKLTGALADSFNYMVAELREIIRNVQASTRQVTTSAARLQVDARRAVETSEEQATEISRASGDVEAMARTLADVAESAQVADGVARDAVVNVRSGSAAVRQTVEGMNRIRSHVQETARRIKRLGESSKEIGEIVKLIGGIADRTSILALNAAIQAASAGEAGRGFAVVAEEVQRLSDRSTEATRQISALVATIQSETHETVVSMEESTREVVEGSRIADLAGQALAEINTVAERIAAIVQSITEAAARQAERSAKISTTMEGIAGMTAQTAESTRQSALAVSRMAELANALRASVSTFRLPEDSAAALQDEREVAVG